MFTRGLQEHAWVLGVLRDDAHIERPAVDWVSVAPQLATASPRLKVRNTKTKNFLHIHYLLFLPLIYPIHYLPY
jgi:hypothetical protein